MTANDALLIAGFILIAALAVAFAVFQSRKRDEWLERAAQQRGGRFRKGSFFKTAELYLPFKDVMVDFHMEPGSKHSSPKTVAQVNLTAPRLPALHLVHNGLWQKMMGAFGRERALTGDEEFDSQWAIRSDDRLAAHKLSSPDLKDKLSDRIFRHLNLRLEPQQMNMTTLAIPSDEEQLNRFIDTAILVLQKFL